MTRNQFYTVENISISELLLDTNNPRIRHGQDPNDCITRILRDRDNFLNLLKDIASKGLTPEHILISKNEEGQWVVRDGNRRVTALKLLNQPELRLLDSSLAPQISRIAQQYNNFPTQVNCLACDDEQSILDYLERKHTGENDGIGQRNWSSLLKSLFNLQLGISDQNKRAAQLVLWVEDRGLRVEDDFPLTTLNRPLNIEALALIGFKIDDDKLEPTLPVHQTYALSARVVNDIATGRIHVRRDDAEGSIYNQEQQLAYFKRVRAEIGPSMDDPGRQEAGAQSSQHSSHARASAETNANNQNDNSSTESNNESSSSSSQDKNQNNQTQDRRPPSPTTPSWERPGLFFRGHPGFGVPSGNTKVANIITELKKLKVKDTPQAVAMVFRTLIEMSEERYRMNYSIPDAGDFVRRISKAADHMKGKGSLSESQHEVVIARSRDGNGILSAKTLHKYVHSTDFHPNYQILNSLWDEIGSFVAACWRD